MGNGDIVVIRIWEGLGNQMFQYAYARALKEKGLDVRLDMNKSYDEVFSKDPRHEVRQVGIQNFKLTLPAINVEEYGKYHYIKRESVKYKAIYNMAKCGLWKYKFYEESVNKKGITPPYSARAVVINSCCYIKGWFQDERYFKHIRKQLLEELMPKKKVRISKELQQALEYEKSVSLHIRRGDYVKTNQVLDMKYYKKAIMRMQRVYKEPLFLIFSDDLDWVKKNLDIGHDCIYVNENKTLQDYEELMVMSKCQSNIIANSTFSWWGAWLNRNPEKMVIASRNCVIPEQKNMIAL